MLHQLISLVLLLIFGVGCSAPATPTPSPVPPTATSTLILPTATETAIPPTATPDSPSIVCIPYDPNSLQIVDLDTSGWELTDGSEQVALLDNENDANQALELAKLYTKTCFIGNQKTKFNMQYWEGSSGLSSSLIDRDCISYNPNNIEVVSIDNRWTLVERGFHYMVAFASPTDAEAALQIVREYDQYCFIGRDNNRSNRIDYIVEYWKQRC